MRTIGAVKGKRCLVIGSPRMLLLQRRYVYLWDQEKEHRFFLLFSHPLRVRNSVGPIDTHHSTNSARMRPAYRASSGPRDCPALRIVPYLS